MYDGFKFPPTMDQHKTMLWHIQKQRWIWGPDISINMTFLPIHKGSCGIALSRNVGAIFFFNQFKSFEYSVKGCLVALVFNFSINDWIKVDGCLYKFDSKVINHPDYGEENKMLSSTSYFNKNSEL